MRKITYILSLFFTLTVFFACKNDPEVKTVETTDMAKQVSVDPNAHYAKAEFGIEGMTCAVGCAKTIEKKLAKMDGVKSATVDFDKKLAMVEYNEDKVTPNSLEEAVKLAGDTYSVENMKTVDHFSNESSSMACPPNCDKDCCKDKKDCPADCQMACCKDKK